MKINCKTPAWPLICLMMLSVQCASVFAQVAYKQTGAATFTIAGTSTLHDWTMTSKEATYQTNFKLNQEGAPIQLNTLVVNIPSESLKSGKGAMDKNAYSSLKTDRYKTITFSLTSAKVDDIKYHCSGELTISGVTKPIEVDATCKVQKDNSLQCSGSKTLKMTDYKVEPPTFMFGSIKTGDEITVSFEVNLTPVKL